MSFIEGGMMMQKNAPDVVFYGSAESACQPGKVRDKRRHDEPPREGCRDIRAMLFGA
ncbi:hypothetical protein ACCS96_34225 [Rhizobium ruizarguesonis]